jgi:CubicO group peptidase (beta-lactamase class C family)
MLSTAGDYARFCQMMVNGGELDAVRTDAGRNPMPGSVGDFGWAGITGTYFWVDPKEKLVNVLMIQVPQATIVPYWRQTRALVYQALVN